MKAMILAAGLGTRLRPYSLLRPKPLFPILNQPLLLATISRLKQAGFSSIIINTHHLREQVRHALKNIEGIHLLEEDVILGTGGGLRNALPLFDDEPVLVTNGDIFHTLDFARLYQEHCAADVSISMAVHDYPRFNTVAINQHGNIVGFGPEREANNTDSLLAFTGIHIIDPEVLKDITPGIASCILDCYRKRLALGDRINPLVCTGHFWTDIGSPADYLQLHAELLTDTLSPCSSITGHSVDTPFYIDQHTAIGPETTFHDWVCIGAGATIGSEVSLTRVVVWDGVQVPDGTIVSDTIIAH